MCFGVASIFAGLVVCCFVVCAACFICCLMFVNLGDLFVVLLRSLQFDLFVGYMFVVVWLVVAEVLLLI